MRIDRHVFAAALLLVVLPAAAFQDLDAGQRALLAPLAGAW